MKTALQLIQDARSELGLSRPTLVVGSQDLGMVQMLALLNGLGDELQRQFDWQALCTEYRFTTQFLKVTGTTTANSAVVTGLSATTSLDGTYMVIGTGISQDTYVQSVDSPNQVTLSQVASASGTVTLNFCKTKYSFPADYDRKIDRTDWDKSRHWALQGPNTSQQWQWLKSGYISTGPRVQYRVMGGYFQTWPPVATADTLGFEYVSRNWARSSAAAAKSSVTADNDTCIFPDRLMTVGLKLKYFEAKGFDTTALYRDYLTQLDIAKANDAGSTTLSMSPRSSSVLIGLDNVPDSGYGL